MKRSPKNSLSALLIIVLLISLTPAFGIDKQFKPILTFDGIGITAQSAAAGYRVAGVFRNSPAFNRIKPGDIITKIDGMPTRGKTVDWFYYNIRKPAGTALELEISRMGTWIKLRIQTASIEINKKTIPGGSTPARKISGFDDNNPTAAITSPDDSLKQGDTFFVFKNNRHIGYARVKKISGNVAVLEKENIKESITQKDIGTIELHYFACFPSHRRSSSRYPSHTRKTTVKQNVNGRANVRVESYILYLDGTRLVSKALIRNKGDIPARGVVCTCYFVTGNDKIIGRKSLEIRVINPGDRKIGIYHFPYKVNPSTNYVEFRDNDTRVKVYKGQSSTNPVLLDLECKFNFE